VDLYASRVDDFVARFREKKVPVLWVGLPPVENAALSANYAFLNDLLRDRVQASGGIYIDAWEGFVDAEAHFVTTGPNLEGRATRLRMPDGVHFTRAGMRKLAHYVEVELRPILTGKGDDPAASAAALANAQPRKLGSSRIILLGAAPRSAGGVLLGGEPSATDDDAAAAAEAKPLVEMAQRTLVAGEPVPRRAGRADDYAWPPTPAVAAPAVASAPAAATSE
jgi:hypothetical protein